MLPCANASRLSQAMTAINLTLRPEISAAFVATVAMNADAGDLAGVLEAFPDEARDVFQRRSAQRVDLVMELVVEGLPYLFHSSFDKAKIHHHAVCRTGST